MLPATTLCGLGAITEEQWRVFLGFCSYPKQNCLLGGLIRQVKDLEMGAI